MEKLIHFIKGIFNSIYYNFPFIFLSVAFPLLFYKLDAGRELLLLLAEPNQFYNLGLVTFSFQLLSLSLWCLPILAVELFSTLTHSFKSEPSKHKLALHLKLLYSNRGDKNYVASEDWAYLPWIVFNYSLITTYWNKAYVEFWLLPLILCIYISLKYLFKSKIQNLKSRKFSSNKFLIYLIQHKILVFLLFLLLHAIPVLLYFVKFYHFNQEVNESSPRLSLFVVLFSNLLIILHILYLYFNRIFERINIQNSLNQIEPGIEFNKASDDQLFSEGIDSVQIEEKYESAKKIHIVIVSLLTLSLLLFYFMMGNSLNLLSPILIAVIISSFIIVAFELFISGQFLLCQIAISISKHRKIPFLRFEIYKMRGHNCFYFNLGFLFLCFD